MNVHPAEVCGSCTCRSSTLERILNPDFNIENEGLNTKFSDFKISEYPPNEKGDSTVKAQTDMMNEMSHYI